MRIAICTVLLMLVALLSAQDSLHFNDPSAFWHVARTYPAGTPEDPGFTATTTRRYTITGDSIVNGEAWSVFISEPTHPDGAPPQFEGLVRQEGDLVFGLREDLTFDTLYDFGLGLGDSTLYLIDGWYSTWLHVIAVDSVQVNGSYRRLMFFEDPQLPPSDLTETWIEGIGSIHGPLFPAGPVTFSTEVPGDSLMLSCYGLDDTVLWNHPGYDICAVNILLGSTERSDTPALAVSPNPSYGPFMLEWPVSESFSIRVSDGTGRSVVASRALRDRSLVDGSHLAPGCYLIVATSTSGYRAMLRWIKE